MASMVASIASFLRCVLRWRAAYCLLFFVSRIKILLDFLLVCFFFVSFVLCTTRSYIFAHNIDCIIKVSKTKT